MAARIISGLANPVFIPPFIFLIISYLNQFTFVEFSWLFGFSVLFFTAIPIITALILSRNLSPGSLDFPSRSSRNSLFAFSILSALIGGTFIVWYFTYPFVRILALIFLFNLLCGFIINLKWKISVHSGTLATGSAYLLLYSFSDFPGHFTIVPGLLLLLIVLPLVIWARYQLRVHSMAELIAGVTMGLVLTALQFLFWVNLW